MKTDTWLPSNTGPIYQRVARHVLLHFGHHLPEPIRVIGRLIRLGPRSGSESVSRMISGGSAGLMMMMALPSFAPPTVSTAAGGGAGEFVDVLCACPGPADLDDTVATISPYATGCTRDTGRHHRDGGLAAAGDHVHVHLALAGHARRRFTGGTQ